MREGRLVGEVFLDNYRYTQVEIGTYRLYEKSILNKSHSLAPHVPPMRSPKSQPGYRQTLSQHDRHPVSNSRETDIQKQTDTYQATPTDRSHPVSSHHSRTQNCSSRSIGRSVDRCCLDGHLLRRVVYRLMTVIVRGGGGGTNCSGLCAQQSSWLCSTRMRRRAMRRMMV